MKIANRNNAIIGFGTFDLTIRIQSVCLYLIQSRLITNKAYTRKSNY